MIFLGKITLQIRNGHPYIDFEKPADYYLLRKLVRKKYKLKTKKKRIVTKYMKKFLHEALISYIKDHSSESKT